MTPLTILLDTSSLEHLKQGMLPLCDDMARLATSIALLGVLWAIGSKICEALAKAEPIDYFALLKPLGIALCIGMFSTLVVGSLDGIMKPVGLVASNIAKSQIQGTKEMQDIVDKLTNEEPLSKEEMLYYLDKQKESETEATDETLSPTEIENQMQTQAKARKASFSTVLMSYITEILAFLLEWLVEAVSTILAVISTFFLIILTIFGPLAFAAACFPAFESSLSAWLSRYISISLWVPITDMFSAMMSRVQQISLQHQINSLEEGVGIDGMIHVVVSVVAVFGLLSIPTVAGWIVQSGGTGSYSRNLTKMLGSKFL